VIRDNAAVATVDVSMPALDAWCDRWLGAGLDEVLFTTGHLSFVIGLRLADRREVVVKVRPAADRLAACTEVQRALWRSGFPCPQPLVGPVPLNGHAANAEVLVPGGDVLDVAGDAVIHYARLLARLLQLAPGHAAGLAPNPPWVAWDHCHDGVWPPPDDRVADLNAHPETAWLDEIGERVQRRLRRMQSAPTVVGHGDWEGHNLRWHGDTPWVVHDWDSVVTGPEPVIVGLAASVWPCGVRPRAATVDESQAFIEAYQHATGRPWSSEETEASWAAGLWVFAFNAKKASLDGLPWLDPEEAAERLRRAAA
jgi:Ser/Thr protein kinase RdoA (MazF antagonist)